MSPLYVFCFVAKAARTRADVSSNVTFYLYDYCDLLMPLCPFFRQIELVAC